MESDFQKQVEEWLAPTGGTKAQWNRFNDSVSGIIRIQAICIVNLKNNDGEIIKVIQITLSSDSPDEEGVRYCVQSMNEAINIKLDEPDIILK